MIMRQQLVQYWRRCGSKLGLRRFSSIKNDNGEGFDDEGVPKPKLMPRVVHPDWYRIPRPDDDPRMIGDYPDVPAESYQFRDPYAEYTDKQGRRNWNEPVPEDYEQLSVWSVDHEKDYGIGWVLGSFALLFGGFFSLKWIMDRYLPNPLMDYTRPRELDPSVAKHFPYGIPKRYTHLTPSSDSDSA